MKNSPSILLIIVAALFTFQSCKKEHEAINLTYDITLVKNQSYQTALPENESKEAYAISTQAAHFKISQLTEEGTGNLGYTYTPAQDFTGTDQVIISNKEEREGKHHGKGGHCGKDKEDIKTITINFTVFENNSK